MDDYDESEVAASPEGMAINVQKKNWARKRFQIHFWQKAQGQGARKARDEAIRHGKRVQQLGVIGAASFPVLNEDLTPKGSAQIIVSTSPVDLVDVPYWNGQTMPVGYRLLAENEGVACWVSDNVEHEEAVEESIVAAFRTVLNPSMRTFSGRKVFVTVSTLGPWTLAGPSCGAAAFAAFNGFFPSVYLTGAITQVNGLTTLMPIAGLAQKVAMLRRDEQTLVSPVDQDNVEEAVQAAGGNYISPADAAFGLINSGASKPTLIGVADLGSLVTVITTSETTFVAKRHVSSQLRSKAEVAPEIYPDDADNFDPAVYRYRKFTAETLREKIATWVATGWPGDSIDTIGEFIHTQQFIDELKARGEFPEVQKAAAKLGTPQDRVDAAFRLGGQGGEDRARSEQRITAWIKAGQQLGNKSATAVPKKKKKKAPAAVPQMVRAKAPERKGKVVAWEDIAEEEEEEAPPPRRKALPVKPKKKVEPEDDE